VREKAEREDPDRPGDRSTGQRLKRAMSTVHGMTEHVPPHQ